MDFASGTSRIASQLGDRLPNSPVAQSRGHMTYFCYVDESGTPELSGNTSHFVLVGLALPIATWKEADRQIAAILNKYGLDTAEIHTAWIARRLAEQDKISGFAQLDAASRRSAVERYRAGELMRLRRARANKAYNQAKKNYQHTEAYIHLTHVERLTLLDELAMMIANWEFAVVFAEAIDKLHFDPSRTGRSVGEQALEQLVSRFEQFLGRQEDAALHGVLVHDNNQTVAKKQTELMRHFHTSGTSWVKLARIAETPLFVDSELTRLVQIADLCSYALRRYLENHEDRWLPAVEARADTLAGIAVGVRHYTTMDCTCRICAAHRPSKKKPTRRVESA